MGCKEVSIAILAKSIVIWVHSRELYVVELHESRSHVLSPLSENKTIPTSNGRNTNKLFDGMKKEVERTRIDCEKLYEKLHEKNNVILCVQMELGVLEANNKFMSQLFLLMIKVLHITFNLLIFDLGVDNNQSIMAHGSTYNDFFNPIVATSIMGQRGCHPLIPTTSILFIKLLLRIYCCSFLGEFWTKRCKGDAFTRTC